MAKRIPPSQINNLIRQAQQKQQQQHRQMVDKVNREIRARNQKINNAVNQYNNAVRIHNARVRANQQRLRNEIARLERRQVTVRYATFHASVRVVQTSYARLELAAEAQGYDDQYNELLDDAEREAANSASVMNALLDDTQQGSAGAPNSPLSPLTPVLASISSDFEDRWRGALYSLSPDNPDAARHFCTSAREILTGILETRAPDEAVISATPECSRTTDGKPTRRSKIHYILQQQGIAKAEVEAFVDSDVDDVVELFKTFNSGTHGDAGRYTLAQLQAIRQRVEDGIMFITKILR